jgi:glycosyltransferase involved in cell wall biosynthesis
MDGHVDDTNKQTSKISEQNIKNKRSKKIKIAHILGSLNSGGAEKIVSDLLENINTNKFEVTLIFWKRGVFYKNFKKIQHLNLIELKPPGKTIFSKAISFFKLIFDLKNIQGKKKFDIMHVHLAPLNIPVILQKLFFKKLKCIYTRHNTDQMYKNKLISFFHRQFNFYFDHITSCSKSVKEHIQKHEKIQQDIQVIYNGVKIDTISQIKKKKYNFLYKKNFNIISVGRLTKQKGYDNLINIFSLLKKEIPSAKLYICGNGPLKKELIQQINNLQLKEDVILLGVRTDIYSLMKNSDLFILLSNWEGLGIVFIEAMACKLPVIGTNVDGIVEVIIDGQTGYLVQKEDKDEIIKKVKEYKHNKNLREKHGELGYKLAKNKFDIKKITKEYEEMYMRVWNYENNK